MTVNKGVAFNDTLCVTPPRTHPCDSLERHMNHPTTCPVCGNPKSLLLETQRVLWSQLQILDQVAARRGVDAVSWAARETLRSLVPESVRNESLSKEQACHE